MERVSWATIRFVILAVTLLAVSAAATVVTDRANRATDPPPATLTGPIPPAAATPILSARRVPEWLRKPIADRLFNEAIEAVMRETPEESCVIVHRNSEPIVERNTAKPLRPGDLQRLVTISALAHLGNNGFRTEVAIRSDAEITEDGVLVGDLWLIGGGDPVLSTRSFATRLAESEMVVSDFDGLAEDTISALRSRGVRSISGRVIGDEQKYTPVERNYVGVEVISMAGQQGEIWTADQASGAAVGPLSGLLLDNGSTEFQTRPIEDDLLDDEATGEDAVGEMVADQPALAAAQAFHNRIELGGIDVENPPEAGVAPSFAERLALASVDSPPLLDIMARALDDTTTAEMLLKEIGIRQGQTSERGLALWGLITGGFEAAGLPYVFEGPVEYHDGSGLSDFNRSTCEMQFATIEKGDHVVSRLLKSRSESPDRTCGVVAEGDLRVFLAAGDTTTGIVGRYVATSGDEFAFTLMVEDPTRTIVIDEAGPAQPFIECNPATMAMLAAITGSPHGPTIEDLLSPATAS